MDETDDRLSLVEVAAGFGKLGLISFGGPVAHLGYLRDEFVTRRRWLEDAEFADVVALCQFLPGPASSQVVYALGLRRAGLAGGLVASLCFTLPSVALMIGFAYGVARAGDLADAGWLHGLKLAAVAVVAGAVWGMGRRLCPDAARLTLCLLAAAALLLVGSVWAQVGVIAAGAVAGFVLYRNDPLDAGPQVASPERRPRGPALLALAAFLALLIGLPILAGATDSRAVAAFDSFYRSGSLVFGGGHVVLPLLEAEVAGPGWVGRDSFLAGYGAAQAVPGPLFSFAAYLGAAFDEPPMPAWINGLFCTLAIFLPSWLLVAGVMQFWDDLRSRRPVRAALAGANAAVVGILLAALYDPVFTAAVDDTADVAAALVFFAALTAWRVPAWAVVLAAAAVGQFAL